MQKKIGILTKYEEIARTIKAEIMNGEYQIGTPLPTEEQLTKQYNVSRQTIRRMMDLLVDEGLIERRHGSGNYVKSSKPISEKTMNIGVITTHITSYIFPMILGGLEEEVTKNGYTISLSSTHNRVAEECSVLTNFSEKSFDGIIVEGTKSGFPNINLEFYRKLIRKNIPILFMHNHYPELTEIPYIAMDDRNGGRLAVQRLIKKGHKKIAGIFKVDDMQGQLRYAGYLDELKNNEIQITDEYIFWYTGENKKTFFSSSNLQLKRVLLSECTAVVCDDDDTVVWLLQCLNETGENPNCIPNQLAIVSFDRSVYTENIKGDFFTFSHQKVDFGKTVAQTMLRMIEGETVKSIVLPWIE